jgi:hypothetical protein
MELSEGDEQRVLAGMGWTIFLDMIVYILFYDMMVFWNVHRFM